MITIVRANIAGGNSISTGEGRLGAADDGSGIISTEGSRKVATYVTPVSTEEIERAGEKIKQYSENLRGMLAELLRLITDMFDKLAATQRTSAAQTRSERWNHDVARFDAMRREADLRFEGGKRQAGFQMAGGLFQVAFGGAGLGAYAIPGMNTEGFQAFSQVSQTIGSGGDKGLSGGGTLEHARYDRDATYKNIEMQFRKEAAEGISGDGQKVGEAGIQSIDRAVDIVRQFVELAKQLNQTIMIAR